MTDLGRLTDISEATAIDLIERWDEGARVLAEHGLTDPPIVEAVLNLVPEIVADILFLQPTSEAEGASVAVVLHHALWGASRFGLRGLPIHKSVGGAIRAKATKQEVLDAIAAESSIADALTNARAEGIDLDGAAFAVTMLGVRCFWGKLLLAGRPNRSAM